MNLNAPVVIGAGGHARSLVSMAPPAERPVMYVAPQPSLPLKWLGDDRAFLSNPDYDELPVIIGIGFNEKGSLTLRRRIIELFGNRRFATIVASDAIVAPDTVIGDGSTVFHRAVINCGAFIGRHTVVNTGAIVEHDVTLGENTFVGPGAVICGACEIGNDVFIGAGATLRNGVRIADGVTVGVGAVVVNDITEKGIYIGNPAKRMK